MSEAASRFTFFPVDERQSLRMGRCLMAAGTSLLLCLALARADRALYAGKSAGRNRVAIG